MGTRLLDYRVIYSNNFISVLAVCVINLITFSSELDLGTWTIILPRLGNPSLLCILGSRLLVNLKEAGKLGLNEGTNYRPDSFSESLSEIEFTERVAEGDTLSQTLLNYD